MRKGCMAIAVLMLAVAIIVPLSSDDADARTMDGLMLYQINPYTCEGVAVHNYGSSEIDMIDYTIADMPSLNGNEGTLTFTSSVKVGAGETLVLASAYSKDVKFCNQDNVLIYGNGGSDKVDKSSNFNLNNSGDDVYLFKGDKIVDAMCYGKTTISDSALWSGSSVTISSDKFVQRVGDSDTNSSNDWKLPGQTSYYFDPDLKYDATVTPFTFPESGGVPVYQAIESATDSIWIEIYMLTSKNMLGLLAEKLNDGVDVKILLEGNPLGYTSSLTDTAPYYRHLINNGAEIRFIGISDKPDFDRFDYVHAKFAIIDGDTTVVTSENWVTDNLNGTVIDTNYKNDKSGNRGWGAIIESSGYARFMSDVFENDWSMDYGDVKEFAQVYKTNKTATPRYSSPSSFDATFGSYDAKVTPILSNDSSYDALEYYASIAEDRLYTEQQSLGSTYQSDYSSGPIGMFKKAAERNVDARIIFSNKAVTDAKQTADLVNDVNSKTAIRAAMMTVPYVHNKGVIADNTVWVSSVNWTDSSFFKNRESCVAIHSEGVADFFATYYLKDFQQYYSFSGFTAYISELETRYDSGTEITISVNVSPSGEYTYTWDLGDGSASRTTTTNRIAASPADGTHTLTVTVTNSDGESVTVQQEYTMGSESPLETLEERPGLIAIIAALILIIIGIVKAATGKKKKSKKKSKGKKR